MCALSQVVGESDGVDERARVARMSAHATNVHHISQAAVADCMTQWQLIMQVIDHCKQRQAAVAHDLGLHVQELPVVWAGHNSDTCDVPDIYQVRLSVCPLLCSVFSRMLTCHGR